MDGTYVCIPTFLPPSFSLSVQMWGMNPCGIRPPAPPRLRSRRCNARHRSTREEAGEEVEAKMQRGLSPDPCRCGVFQGWIPW